jgi:hypothetical protein
MGHRYRNGTAIATPTTCSAHQPASPADAPAIVEQAEGKQQDCR